jgi:hypothetical protein
MEFLMQQIFTAAQQGSERVLLELIEHQLLSRPLTPEATEECLNYYSKAAIGDIFTTSIIQCTPLIIAIINNNISCVKVLLLHMHKASSVNKPDVRTDLTVTFLHTSSLRETVSLT